MNEFIHTFSFVIYITEAQRKRMKDTYGNKLFPGDDKSKWIFSQYAENGLRAEMIHTPIIEKLKRKIYEDYKVTWVVTPAKLIYPGQPMKKLYTSEEYVQSCNLLYEIIEDIKTDSGVDLFHKAKLYRVDLTKDITTPSEAYTQEVIRLAKIALKKYGYELLNLNTIEEKREDWKDENAVFFHNDNQEVQAKIYNKIEDMKIHGYDTAGYAGLLRFELALKRQFMKDNGYIREKFITAENLPDTLTGILAHAPELMQKYIADPLWSGAMVSKDQQKRKSEDTAATKRTVRNIKK